MSEWRELQAERIRELGYDEETVQVMLEELEAALSTEAEPADSDLETSRYEPVYDEQGEIKMEEI